jgi:hypothetical protein
VTLRRASWAFSCAAALSCGGPLDRRDGALVVELVDVPEIASAIVLRLEAGGRSSEVRVALPVERITSFSAVPVGTATLDAKLFAGDALLAEKDDLAVEITENVATEIALSFELGPSVTVLDPPENAAHLITDGKIPITVFANDPSLPIELHFMANGAPIDALFASDRWIGEVDPSSILSGAILPSWIEIAIEACPLNVKNACSVTVRPVEVHRRAWSLRLEGASRATPPVWDEARGLVIIGDDRGMLRIANVATGELVTSAIDLGSPLTKPIALSNDRVLVPAEGSAFVIDLDAHAITLGPIALGANDPSGAAFDGARFVIGAGTRLLAIDPRSGSIVELASFPGRIRATPLADDRGVIAADVLGNIVSLDVTGAVMMRASAGGLVHSTPVRDGEEIVVATASGRLIRFGSNGIALGAPIELGAPVVHPLIFVGGEVVAAADDRLIFATREGVRSVLVGGTITGAPAMGSEGRVIAGLADGRVTIVDRSGNARILARVGRTAYAPRPIASDRVLVAGSHGNLELLLAGGGR